jgi:hypothetical protein
VTPSSSELVVRVSNNGATGAVVADAVLVRDHTCLQASLHNSITVTPCTSLPYCINFTSSLPAGWTTPAGVFGFSALAARRSTPCGLASYSLTASNTGTHNVALWQDFDNCGFDSSLNKQTSTDVFLPENGGYDVNGGIVLNYHQQLNGLPGYLLAGVSYASNRLCLWHFDSTQLTPIATVAFPGDAPLIAGRWYRLTATVKVSALVNRLAITVKLQDLEFGAVPVTTLSTVVSSTVYGPATGKPGLASAWSVAQFGFFQYTEIPL